MHHSNIFSALADPHRVMITEMLAKQGQMNASQISAQFDISAPAISQHLKVLRDADVVVMEKHAQQRLYQINPEVFNELEDWITKMKNVWQSRFDQLEVLLQSREKNEKNKRVKYGKT